MRPSIGFYIAFCFCNLELFSNHITSQTETAAWFARPDINIGGFGDVFYAYVVGMPEGNVRQPFLYNYNRYSAFILNHWLFKLSLDHPKYHTNITRHSGTHMRDKYAAEPWNLQHIYEVNIGMVLTANSILCVDKAKLTSIATQFNSKVCI